MANTTKGVSFLYTFTLGELNAANPGVNVISVSSTASGDHDKANLTTTPLRQTWRSATVTTPQQIVMQANDTTIVPDTFLILNHNFSSNAVVSIECANTTNFAGSLKLFFVWNPKHMILTSDVGSTFNYYRITVSDSGNGCGYLDIGRIIAGRAFTFDYDEDMSDSFTMKKTDKSYQMPTEGYFRANNERVKIQTLNISFEQLNSSTYTGRPVTNYKNLVTMVEFVGTTLPFFTIVDSIEPYFKFIWGQLTSMPDETYDVNRYVSTSLDIQEVY